MKMPWLNRKWRKEEDRKTEPKQDKESKSIFKFNENSYSEESLSNEIKSLIAEIQRSEKIINHQKNKIDLLQIAQKIAINDLRKNIETKD